MKSPSGSTTRLAQVKQLAGRFAFASMVAAAFALMLLGKADTVLVERMRGSVTDAVTPLFEMLSRPAATMAEFVDNVRNLATVRTENTRLREENAKLLRWQSVARQLEAENGQLRGLLNFVPGPDAGFIAARVVADTGGAFAHSLLVNAGARDGVRKGQAVLAGDGLVGRVAQVGQRSARVLLVTDLNSRIPVLVESSRARAILSGDNGERPRLNYLSDSMRVEAGDRVVTSGHGGVLPPGLPVGVAVQAGDGWRVEPFASRYRLEYVRIVDYGLSGILGPAEDGRAVGSGR
ncbi:MAG: rod shape-determining protein MreC [Rhodospirillales bacterium]|nr:rod shape-determining protein MreC [Rhodospirillales bacterium]